MAKVIFLAYLYKDNRFEGQVFIELEGATARGFNVALIAAEQSAKETGRELRLGPHLPVSIQPTPQPRAPDPPHPLEAQLGSRQQMGCSSTYCRDKTTTTHVLVKRPSGGYTWKCSSCGVGEINIS